VGRKVGGRWRDREEISSEWREKGPQKASEKEGQGKKGEW
jgi:hypothetical protein